MNLWEYLNKKDKRRSLHREIEFHNERCKAYALVAQNNIDLQDAANKHIDYHLDHITELFKILRGI